MERPAASATPHHQPLLGPGSSGMDGGRTEPPRVVALLGELSPEQMAAVVDTFPRTLVLAGAGSGKTRVLVARIAHLLLERGIPPSGLLAFSFTRKACLEIAHRLASFVERSGVSLRLPQMTFTFHAFAFRLVRRHHEALGFERMPRVVTAEDTPGPEGLFCRFFEQLPGPKPAGSPARLF